MYHGFHGIFDGSLPLEAVSLTKIHNPKSHHFQIPKLTTFAPVNYTRSDQLHSLRLITFTALNYTRRARVWRIAEMYDSPKVFQRFVASSGFCAGALAAMDYTHRA